MTDKDIVSCLDAATSRARAYIKNHHPNRTWTEELRHVIVAAEIAADALRNRGDRGNG